MMTMRRGKSQIVPRVTGSHLMVPKCSTHIITSFILISCLFITSTRGIEQRFALEPQDRTAIVGETIIMACRVVNKKGAVQWAKDQFGLGTERELRYYPRYSMTGNDDEGEYSLQIRDVSLEDDAKFQCQVGPTPDGAKQIKSREATLTVYAPPEPPKIVGGEFLRTTAGNEVELTCEAASGKPPAELTWLDGDGNPASVGKLQHSKQLLSDGKRENSALKWTFTATKDDDGKVFTCRSENQALKQPQKAFVKIEVKFKPEVTLTPDKEHVTDGDQITFTCSATANPSSDMIYKWYKNNEIIPGDYSTRFTIHQVTKEWDDATISCEVSNTVGTSKSSYRLKINYGPFFRRQLKESYGVTLGEEVKLVCDIAGSPRPEIIWLFEKGSKVLSTSSELIIPAMNYETSGRYTCRASVPNFPELSASTQVFIKGPPSLDKSAPIQLGSEGERVTVECLIQSVPPPSKITWTRNSQPIDVDNNLGFELREEKKDSESLIKNLLVISKAKKDDFAVYNCSAENEFGQQSMLITMKEQEHFPSFQVIGMIIFLLVVVVSVTIVVILCIKGTSGLDASEGLHDKKKKELHTNQAMDASSTSTDGHHHGGHHEWKPHDLPVPSSSSEHSSATEQSKSIPPPFHPSFPDNYHKVEDMNHVLGPVYDTRYNLVADLRMAPTMGVPIEEYYQSHKPEDMNNVLYCNTYDTRYNMVCDLTGSSTLTGVNVTTGHMPVDPAALIHANNWKMYNTSTLV